MKYIHWTMPFGNVDGTIDYKLDIYKYAASAPAEVAILRGGDTPLTTEESNDGVFAAVVGQSGSLCIANTEASLGMIDELMPRDNTKRFVRLWRVDATGERRRVMWQGFLSASEYTQGYTSRMEVVTIPVNSLLRSMEYVYAKQKIDDENGLAGIVTVKELIEYCLVGICRKAGVKDVITDYYIPFNADGGIMDKKVNTHQFFETGERKHSDHTEVYVKGKSLSEILSTVCTYMGWTAREQGQTIYFTDPYDKSGRMQHYKSAGGKYEWVEMVETHQMAVSDMVWRGVGHNKTIRSGKKVVSVSASVKGFDDMSLPTCPYIDMEFKDRLNMLCDEDLAAMEAVVCKAVQPYTNMQFGYHKSKLSRDAQGGIHIDGYQGVATQQEWVDSFPLPIPTFDLQETHIAGAGMVFMNMTTTDFTKKMDMVKRQFDRMTSGLYCNFMPGLPYKAYEPIFRMRSVKSYCITEGYLRLDADMKFGAVRMSDPNVPTPTGIVLSDIKDVKCKTAIWMSLRVGNMYWTGSYWNASESMFKAEFDGSNFVCNDKTLPIKYEDGIIMPVESNKKLEGEIEVAIYPVSELSTPDKGALLDVLSAVFFSKLTVEHVQPFSHILSDDSENVYTALTGFNFDEEESVSTEVATFRGNTHSPSLLLLEDEKTPADGIVYTPIYGSQGVKMRPEEYRLESMRQYYGAPRTNITLHTSVAPLTNALPTIVFTGYEGKVYMPLLNKRNWRSDIDEVTLYEVGDEVPDTEPDEDDYYYSAHPQGGSGTGGDLSPDEYPDRPDNGGQEGDDDNDYDQGDPTDPSEPDTPDGPDPEGPDIDGPDGPDYDGPDEDY